MLDVKLFQSHTFLPLPYEAALGPLAEAGT